METENLEGIMDKGDDEESERERNYKQKNKISGRVEKERLAKATEGQV